VVLNSRWPVVLLLILITSISIVGVVPIAGAQDFPHVEASKTVTPTRVDNDAVVEVVIHLRGAGGKVATPVDVVLIFDRSGSMTGKKIADAKVAAKTFLGFNDERDRVALIIFSSTVKNVTELTFMTSANKALLNSTIDHLVASGSTDMYDAMVSAYNMLQKDIRPGVPRVVVLLTDGIHNWPKIRPDSDFQDLANQAKAKDILYFTVGLGTDAETDRLKMIAETTGGEYHFAATSDQLKGIYEEIGGKLAFAGTNINVTERVPSYLVYNDDATKTPIKSTDNGDVILQWHAGQLMIGEEWEVRYTARATRAVDANPNVVQCKVEYMTSESAFAILNLTPGIVYHDIVLTGFKATPNVVEKEKSIRFDMSVKNLGNYRDSIDLRTSIPGSTLDTRTIALDPGQSLNVSFVWNTGDLAAGKYLVTAEIDPDNKIWESNRNDNKAETTIEIINAASGGILLVIIFTIIAVAVAGTAVGLKSGRWPMKYACRCCRTPLKYSNAARQWYCPRCGKPYVYKPYQ